MIFNLKKGSASTDLHGSNGGGGFRTVLKLPFGLVVCYRVRWVGVCSYCTVACNGLALFHTWWFRHVGDEKGCSEAIFNFIMC